MAEKQSTISRGHDIWLLITAHPDDESMFFIPTLKNLCDVPNVHVLCLSNGDYRDASDGPIRTREMHEACSLIGIRNRRGGSRSLTVVDDERMRDGPNEVWSPGLVSETVLEHIREAVTPSAFVGGNGDASGKPAHDYLLSSDPSKEVESWRYAKKRTPQSSISMESFVRSTSLNILTFDQGGVSGHPNHVDVYRGIRYLLNEKCEVARDKRTGSIATLRLCRETNDSVVIEMNVTVRTLRTISNPLQKYLLWAFMEIVPFLILGLLQFFWYLAYLLIGGLLWSKGDPHIQSFTRVLKTDAEKMQCRIMDPTLVWRAMAAHRSQFVWYRRLSVMFSRYTYINDLQKMTIDTPAYYDDDDAEVDESDIASLPPVVTVKEEDDSPKFLLSPMQIYDLRAAVLPPALHHRPWKRIYSLARDGDSFVAFRNRMEEWHGSQGHQSSLLVVKTAGGDVIGGYADVPIVPLASAAGLSAARSCLFKLGTEKDAVVEVYGKHCTMSSKGMVFDATRRVIAFGGGDGDGGSDGGFGLSLDDGFARGTTARCAAFQSEPLVADQGGVFDVLDVEVWGFLFGRIVI
jgi:N-acetylglucosaminylphosphatidylinositol deacetylase